MSTPVEYRLLGGLSVITTTTESEQHQAHPQTFSPTVSTMPMFDQENENRINNLLQEWGKSVSSPEQVKVAKKQVDDFRIQQQQNRKNEDEDVEKQPQHQQQQKELFTYNPYRPQGGNGFPGKPMWTALLAETATFRRLLGGNSNHDDSIDDMMMMKNIAKIFRVDPEHNEAILEVLKKQDEIVEAALVVK